MWTILGLAILVYLAEICRAAQSPTLAPGEADTQHELSSLGPNFHVLNDLMLPSPGNLPTTQIDHVVVSKYGIFCVETKGYGGLVLGSDGYRTWRSYQGKNYTEFQNPVHQNKVHLEAFAIFVARAGLKAEIRSLVSLPHAQKIEAISAHAFVGSAGEVGREIQQCCEPVMSQAEVELLVEMLEEANIKDPEVREYHNLKVQAHVKRLRRSE